ncbi:PEP-CTERM sorting domain-containing protein [Coraliomargarita algicola]|uniref:PEP-CTERM sorting domain-containing protein n=1 Tax=Coraliomargarita algicola TaxID=3092156 RepID=A0ABZ0RN68_9BACT|nr:PEP-CTERM sorting domain-containing protein [Coraliomargarita sp. J2-16]WPJ96430.1 PEP-CTERM sorting domain-containing protein [Coraliomargarita sp. J2-16]
MRFNRLHPILFAAAIGAASSAIAATEYTETFTVSSSSTFSSVGWNVYLKADSSVNDLSSTGGSSIAEIWSTDYGYIRTQNEVGYSTTDGPALMFTTEPTSVLDTTNISSISKLSVGIRADGSGTDIAEGRFAIQIGSQWYVSAISATSNSNLGPPSSSNLPEEFTTLETAALFDFSDGNNWHELTVALGSEGEISIAGSATGGTLSGDVTAFGIYAKNGANGDHFRIDNYTVVVPEPSTIILPALVGIGLMLRRRHN